MTVIRDVDENTANAILYGFNSETTEYFKNKYNMFKESIVTNNPLANTHAGFFNNLNYINSDAYITNIKDKLHSLSVAGNDDENIYYYNNKRIMVKIKGQSPLQYRVQSLSLAF